MTVPGNWRKSSYSGDGDGDECVELSTTLTHVAVRDSKTRTTHPLTFPVSAFTAFISALKAHPHP